MDDNTCLFCIESESVQHLFFECAVARQVWVWISEVIDRNIGSSFESIGSMWLSNKRFLGVTCFVLLPCGGFGN